MLRTINYTVSAAGTQPFSPQFAGVQGENGATKLVFTPDEAFAGELTDLREQYDTLYYRFDCVDGAGRTVTGEIGEYGDGSVSLILSSELTEAGGDLRICLILSGENNGEESGTRLFSFPVRLYFKEFPLRMSFTERGDLNHAIKQIGEMRGEIYDLVQSAESTCGQNATLVAQADTLITAAQEASQSAASYASTALTNAVSASGYAESARQSAADAADSLAELLALVGNLNAVLALLVDAA